MPFALALMLDERTPTGELDGCDLVYDRRHERTSISKRKQSLPRCTRPAAQRRAGTRFQGESPGRETTHAASRRRAQGGLHVSVGQRGKGWTARQVLGALRGQADAAAV